ncbi:MAG: transcription-repair coupling factor [Bacteroidetes bacterium]|nr:transcription-repair coupling factor [Bacteroidota bacterium]
MKKEDILAIYQNSARTVELVAGLRPSGSTASLKGFQGSSQSFAIASAATDIRGVHLVMARDREEAAYLQNDLEGILSAQMPVFYYPASFKVPYSTEATDNANIAMRSEVLQALKNHDDLVIVSFHEAIGEHVVSRKEFSDISITVSRNEAYDMEWMNEQLLEMHFEKVDYVYEPGQFSIRGGIVDIFSFVNERPYRIELFGKEVESIREFDPVSQLSDKKFDRLTILPNVDSSTMVETRESFLAHIPEQSILWFQDLEGSLANMDKDMTKVEKAFHKLKSPLGHRPPHELYHDAESFKKAMKGFRHVTLDGKDTNAKLIITASQTPQPAFNKKFDLLHEDLAKHHEAGYVCVITAGNAKQIERLYNIFEDIGAEVEMKPIVIGLKEGFIDHDNKLVLYTDHQIFERYNRFRLKEGFKRTKEALTLQELMDLQPGDFITHIDHGVGKFSGLEKVDVNGKMQEAIRIIYKDNDILYVSIHSLHRISKFTGKEGTEPTLHKLGSATWAKQKLKAKSKVKQLAFDLIKLYAERKAKKGFPFTPDSYLQTELEASFIYEDTPDQESATLEVKTDMEKEMPMDRLVCGDVGFGKTEIAIRAAFKAVADSKQVAVLVPTTVLCFQHYQTFSARLRDFPAKVEYLNRFRTQKEQTKVLKALADGEVDIVIGTHKLLSDKVKFKDLGLMIIDEEQKFGVGAKDKLKTLRTEVDSLTLTATPIPRTLQFSLMGARDLSVIRTPPPNRYPVDTRVVTFHEEIIRDAVAEELKRGGQVFFVHNKIENIKEIAGMVNRLVPEARVAVGHGQMDGKKLEEVMLDFIDGAFDVLVSTTIIESGIDIPNANTMIINNAQNFGLSDLHQLRGRVGRGNKKAHCILIAPPMHMVSSESRKRLEAIEQFSDLGSGMSIAMRDLDIRGAGDLLGAEQSGFISDIGFETYQKILNETIQELKETEFKELFSEELAAKRGQIEEVSIETDLELLLPDEYVAGTTERLKLYREMDGLASEEELAAFILRMEDRFGPAPKPTLELYDSLRLRWLARELGFDKLVVKAGKMIGHFVADQEHPFYQSARFTFILRMLQQANSGLRMYEKNDSLRLVFEEIEDIHASLNALKRLLGETVQV